MKLKLVYYKCLLDIAVRAMFEHANDLFIHTEDERYVYAGGVDGKLKKFVVDGLADAFAEYTPGTDDMYIVIGSCFPKDNILLDFKDGKYFPSKLSKLINEKPTLKYILAEDGIEIDINYLNDVFNSVFNGLFCGRKALARKILKDRQKQFVFVSHKDIDCYAMFKILKWIYGSSNCVNVWKESMQDVKPCLVALNDVISKYISNKMQMNRSSKFKSIANEVKAYLAAKTGINIEYR